MLSLCDFSLLVSVAWGNVRILGQSQKACGAPTCSSNSLIFSKGSASAARGRPSTGSYEH
jgi:hypothetical protein